VRRERVGQQAGEGHLADADPAFPQEMPARYGFGHEWFTINHRFSPW
jgi:hypothetical protein